MSIAIDPRLLGARVLDEYGEFVGAVEEVICSADGEPIWVKVRIGMFGTLGSVVPLNGCAVDAAGVHFPYARATIEAVPFSRLDTGLNVPALLAYYGLELPTPSGL